MSILGQLAKKYWGELVGQEKFDLTEEIFLLGFRTLKFHYTIIESCRDELIEHVANLIKKKSLRESLTKEEVENISGDFVFTLSSSSAFGILKRLVNAVGTTKLSDTFEHLGNCYPTNAMKLALIGIKLDHYSELPSAEIGQLAKDNRSNPLGYSTLQSFVIDHLYMYPVPYDKKQQICSQLNIRLEDQRVIQQTSQIRK
ncbi:MAG: hypothetical protein A1D16_13965 [Flavihumibacter sp. CACIAM 22H1]|nr:MAG: hypothetical protein A1D16_13965 [Flavihumibacter sp. CACIAM 22H1]